MDIIHLGIIYGVLLLCCVVTFINTYQHLKLKTLFLQETTKLNKHGVFFEKNVIATFKEVDEKNKEDKAELRRETSMCLNQIENSDKRLNQIITLFTQLNKKRKDK